MEVVPGPSGIEQMEWQLEAMMAGQVDEDWPAPDARRHRHGGGPARQCSKSRNCRACWCSAPMRRWRCKAPTTVTKETRRRQSVNAG